MQVFQVWCGCIGMQVESRLGSASIASSICLVVASSLSPSPKLGVSSAVRDWVMSRFLSFFFLEILFLFFFFVGQMMDGIPPQGHSAAMGFLVEQVISDPGAQPSPIPFPSPCGGRGYLSQLTKDVKFEGPRDLHGGGGLEGLSTRRESRNRRVFGPLYLRWALPSHRIRNPKSGLQKHADLAYLHPYKPHLLLGLDFRNDQHHREVRETRVHVYLPLPRGEGLASAIDHSSDDKADFIPILIEAFNNRICNSQSNHSSPQPANLNKFVTTNNLFCLQPHNQQPCLSRLAGSCAVLRGAPLHLHPGFSETAPRPHPHSRAGSVFNGPSPQPPGSTLSRLSAKQRRSRQRRNSLPQQANLPEPTNPS